MQKFMNLPIMKKLLLAFFTVGLAPVAIVSWMSLDSARSTIEAQVSNQLIAVKEIKAREVERYFERVRNQVKTLSADPAVVAAAQQLPRAYSSYIRELGLSKEQIAERRQSVTDYYRGEFANQYQEINGAAVDTSGMFEALDDTSWALQYAYISNNPNPLGEKDNLNSADDGTRYSRLHEQLHPKLRTFLKNFDYYDIFIADAETGDIIYSVYKELDYTTSLKNGPYASTSIGEAYAKGVALANRDDTVLADFRTYRPSYDAPASFVASPIQNQGGETIAILIFQMPIEDINAIMNERSGMGETGETYMVGSDYLMRSDSFLDPENHNVVSSFKHPEKGSVKTQAVERALQAESGADIITDYNGNPVVSAFAPVNLGDFQWVVLAEQDVAEAFAPAVALRNLVLGISLVCALGVLLIGYWIGKLIANPVLKVSRVLSQVSDNGEFHHRVHYACADEVGQMSRDFDEFLQSLADMFSETNRVLGKVGEGDLNSNVEGTYRGDMASLSDGVNQTIVKIREAQAVQAEQKKQVEQAAAEAAAKAKEAEEIAVVAKRTADEATRVRQALDVASTGVMMADENNQIAYMNDALSELMLAVESDIKRALPNFNAKELKGQSMDVFHVNPAHQRQLIANLQDTFRTEITVGGRTFRLIANPIMRDGQRMGTVVEWADRTNEVSIEKEIDTMVEAAARGDFSVQLSEEGKQGFFASLTSGLNRLVSTTDSAMRDVADVIRSMSEGNLTRKIDSHYEGMFAELKSNVNGTLERLVEVVGEISIAAEQVKNGSFEISAGMRDLSARTEEQAASLEETASTMAQMTQTVKSSTDNAVQADSMARNAERKAVEGGEVVKEAVVAMDAINQASKQIADIIGVIDEIAFQTNLLALNAAVEAARAGEQGRGFAVVASEVRNLAQRSSNAAKEIKALINDSVERVELGSALVNRSGETLSEIVSAVEQVGKMIAEIANGAKEQSVGIEQVNVAVSQIDESTQQNSALVEQTTAAGEAISGQSEAMAEAVRFFKID